MVFEHLQGTETRKHTGGVAYRLAMGLAARPSMPRQEWASFFWGRRWEGTLQSTTV